MNDTSPKIAAKMEEMFRQKSPSARLAMGCSMFDLSKKLIESSFIQENPMASYSDLRQELFLRFYGCDFNQVERQKILKHLNHLARSR